MHAWAVRLLDPMKEDLFVDNCIACGWSFPPFFSPFLNFHSAKMNQPCSASQQLRRWCCEFKIIDAIQFSNENWNLHRRRVFFFAKSRQFKIIAVCFVWLVKSLFFFSSSRNAGAPSDKNEKFYSVENDGSQIIAHTYYGSTFMSWFRAENLRSNFNSWLAINEP